MPARLRRSKFLFALVVVIGVAVVARMLLWSDRSATETGGAKGANARQATPPLDDLHRAADANREMAGHATRQVELPQAANSSSSFPPLDWKPGPPNGFAIRVVDARTRKPIANAHLVVVSMQIKNARNEIVRATDGRREPGFDDLVRVVVKDAGGFVSDATGMARVERPAGPAWVLGEAGDLRGARELVTPGRDDFELLLTPRRSVEVEVVNARGEPVVGAHVGWASRGANGLVRFFQEPVAVDSRGHARIERPDTAITNLGVAVPFAGERGRDPAVFVEDGDSDTANAGPSEADRGPKTIHCVVPGEYGTIAIRLVDEAGQLSPADAQIQFEPLNRPRRRRDGNSTSWMEDLVLSMDFETLTGGRGTFAPVPLRLSFKIEAMRARETWARRNVTGPRIDGETVEVELKSPGSKCHVHGRLVGVAKPTEVSVSFDGDDDRSFFRDDDGEPGRVNGHAARTLPIGEDGTFEIDAITVLTGGPEGLDFIGFDALSGQGFEAEASLPEGLSSADIDLGAVHVHVSPIVASGRVLSPAREPLPGVEVKLADDDSGRRTDPSGRFVFLGERQELRLELHIDAERGFASTTVEFAVGTRNLEIVLERQGGIAGRLLADREITIFALARGGAAGRDPRRLLETNDRGGPSVRSRLDEPAKDVDRSFTLSLDPGSYDVCASLGGAAPEAALLFTVPGVEVVAGKTTRDPRLDPLDLRGTIHAWHFTLERSDHAPPPSAWVRLAAPDHDDEFTQTLYIGLDGATCVSSLESAWVDFAHPGFRHIHELHSRGDVKLVLEPVDSHPLEVHVAIPTHARAAEITWLVRAEPSWKAPVADLSWFSAPVGADGKARLELDDGETWHLRLYAVAHENDREKRIEIARLGRVLRERDLERGSIDLQVDPSDLDAALAALGK